MQNLSILQFAFIDSDLFYLEDGKVKIVLKRINEATSFKYDYLWLRTEKQGSLYLIILLENYIWNSKFIIFFQLFLLRFPRYADLRSLRLTGDELQNDFGNFLLIEIYIREYKLLSR